MFLGSYDHTLDEKGRVVMPSKYREALKNGCVVTKGQDGCLYVFTQAQFEAEAARLNRLPRTERRFRNYMRSFFSSATDAKLDKAGRVQLPENLRVFAGLEKELKVNGVSDHIEIWAPSAWSEHSASADEYYTGIEEALWEAEDA